MIIVPTTRVRNRKGWPWAVFAGNTYLFLGLERVGGVVVYDITHPQHPAFMAYLNNRDFSGDAEAFTAGDLGPEGLKFVPASDTPTRTPWLIVGNEVSGTTTLYDLGTILVPAADDYEVDSATSDSITFSYGEDDRRRRKHRRRTL